MLSQSGPQRKTNRRRPFKQWSCFNHTPQKMSSEVKVCIKTQPTPDNEQKEPKGLNTQANNEQS